MEAAVAASPFIRLTLKLRITRSETLALVMHVQGDILSIHVQSILCDRSLTPLTRAPREGQGPGLLYGR